MVVSQFDSASGSQIQQTTDAENGEVECSKVKTPSHNGITSVRLWRWEQVSTTFPILDVLRFDSAGGNKLDKYSKV